jgi:hypothetical protein
MAEPIVFISHSRFKAGAFADAMERHLEGADERAAKALEFIDSVGYEIYGSPSEVVLERMQEFADHTGATLTVLPHHIAGYLRSATG